MAGTVLNDATSQAKATFELARNLAEGKSATEGPLYLPVNILISTYSLIIIN